MSRGAAIPAAGQRPAQGAIGARLLLWSAVGVGAALRFWALTASSLWSDEGNSWAIVQRSVVQIARDAAADIHPPLYYWLLKLWSAPGGYTPAMVRSFSALCGVALIVLIAAIARRAAAPHPHPWLPALAAWVAALSPFQIYYSQEARMYMLLAVEAAALLLILLALLERSARGERTRLLLAGYALITAAGLWTHYSFAIVPAALGAAWLIDWARRTPRTRRALGGFVAANLAALLLFAPWLPIALRQIAAWPQGGERVGLVEGLRLTLHTLLFGLMRPTPAPLWPWLAAAGLLPLLGMAALRRRRSLWPVALLLAAPIVLMAGLGLFTDAFLKFLLVASAPWCVLVAAAPEGLAGRPRLAGAARAALGSGAAALALLTLPGYYTKEAARDNYQGIAAALAATHNADPDSVLVILDAPGQADVWRAYNPGIETLALPTTRPPDPAAVAAQLAAATAGKQTVYALFWATDEADPDGLVERWLNETLYKGLESWQGNVRLALYRTGEGMECRATDLPISRASAGESGIGLRLEAVCRPPAPDTLRPGEPAALALRWSVEGPPDRDLAVSIQALDTRGQVIAQQDGAPAGGLRPTSTWEAGDAVEDRRALLIPPGTPPGVYRLAAVVYDPATGERFTGPEGDLLELGTLTVEGATTGAAGALFTPMQVRADTPVGDLVLAGYDLYKKGFAHAPETPLEPGDLLHVTLYWKANAPLREPEILLALGGQRVTGAPAGRPLPSEVWANAGLLRGEFDIAYDGRARRPTLTVGDETILLAPLP